MNKVVIGIITYNRNELLEKALISLRKCSIPDNYIVRLVVCDNYISDSTRKVVESISFKFPCEYLLENKQGIPFARNKIVERAIELDANYLMFFDDDEQVDPSWISEIIRFHANNNSEATIGRVESIYSENVPNWIKDSKYFEKKRAKTGKQKRYAATSNIIYDLKIFKDWKLRYDERFALSGGTDNYLAAEILYKGGSILYCDEALVTEEVPAHRANIHWILKRIYRSRVNDVRYLKILHKSLLKSIFIVFKKIIEEANKSLQCLMIYMITFDKSNSAKSLFHLMSILGYIGGLFGLKYQEYRKPV